MSTLSRELNLIDAVAVGFGAIVGAGIFVVSGIAAGMAGPALLVALVLAGGIAAANALSSAWLAAAYPQAGGTYEYGYQLLHPWAGFVAGWMFLASKIAAAGTVALGLAAYAGSLVPGLPGNGVAAGAVVAFTVLNLFGIRRTSAVNIGIVLVSVGALLSFCALALPQLRVAQFTPFAPHGLRGVLSASALLFFAYTGYARIATLGEEVRTPERTIPRAVGITIAGAIVLYLLVAVAAIGVVGAEPLAASAAPLLVAARATGTPIAVPVVLAGAAAAMLGVILSQILGLSRMAFAMARRSDLPRALAHVDARGTPARAVIAVGAVAAVIALTGSLTDVAAAAAFCILVYYGIANAAALRLRPPQRTLPAVVPVAGLTGCIVLALSLSTDTLRLGALVLAAGVAVRLASRLLR